MKKIFKLSFFISAGRPINTDNNQINIATNENRLLSNQISDKENVYFDFSQNKPNDKVNYEEKQEKQISNNKNNYIFLGAFSFLFLIFIYFVTKTRTPEKSENDQQQANSASQKSQISESAACMIRQQSVGSNKGNQSQGKNEEDKSKKDDDSFVDDDHDSQILSSQNSIIVAKKKDEDDHGSNLDSKDLEELKKAPNIKVVRRDIETENLLNSGENSSLQKSDKDVNNNPFQQLGKDQEISMQDADYDLESSSDKIVLQQPKTQVDNDPSEENDYDDMMSQDSGQEIEEEKQIKNNTILEFLSATNIIESANNPNQEQNLRETPVVTQRKQRVLPNYGPKKQEPNQIESQIKGQEVFSEIQEELVINQDGEQDSQVFFAESQEKIDQASNQELEETIPAVILQPYESSKKNIGEALSAISEEPELNKSEEETSVLSKKQPSVDSHQSQQNNAQNQKGDANNSISEPTTNIFVVAPQPITTLENSCISENLNEIKKPAAEPLAVLDGTLSDGHKIIKSEVEEQLISTAYQIPNEDSRGKEETTFNQAKDSDLLLSQNIKQEPKEQLILEPILNEEPDKSKESILIERDEKRREDFAKIKGEKELNNTLLLKAQHEEEEKQEHEDLNSSFISQFSTVSTKNLKNFLHDMNEKENLFVEFPMFFVKKTKGPIPTEVSQLVKIKKEKNFVSAIIDSFSTDFSASILKNFYSEENQASRIAQINIKEDDFQQFLVFDWDTVWGYKNNEFRKLSLEDFSRLDITRRKDLQEKTFQSMIFFFFDKQTKIIDTMKKEIAKQQDFNFFFQKIMKKCLSRKELFESYKYQEFNLLKTNYFTFAIDLGFFEDFKKIFYSELLEKKDKKIEISMLKKQDDKTLVNIEYIDKAFNIKQICTPELFERQLKIDSREKAYDSRIIEFVKTYQKRKLQDFVKSHYQQLKINEKNILELLLGTYSEIQNKWQELEQAKQPSAEKDLPSKELYQICKKQKEATILQFEEKKDYLEEAEKIFVYQGPGLEKTIYEVDFLGYIYENGYKVFEIDGLTFLPEFFREISPYCLYIIQGKINPTTTRIQIDFEQIKKLSKAFFFCSDNDKESTIFSHKKPKEVWNKYTIEEEDKYTDIFPDLKTKEQFSFFLEEIKNKKLNYHNIYMHDKVAFYNTHLEDYITPEKVKEARLKKITDDSNVFKKIIIQMLFYSSHALNVTRYIFFKKEENLNFALFFFWKANKEKKTIKTTICLFLEKFFQFYKARTSKNFDITEEDFSTSFSSSKIQVIDFVQAGIEVNNLKEIKQLENDVAKNIENILKKNIFLFFFAGKYDLFFFGQYSSFESEDAFLESFFFGEEKKLLLEQLKKNITEKILLFDQNTPQKISDLDFAILDIKKEAFFSEKILQKENAHHVVKMIELQKEEIKVEKEKKDREKLKTEAFEKQKATIKKIFQEQKQINDLKKQEKENQIKQIALEQDKNFDFNFEAQKYSLYYQISSETSTIGIVESKKQTILKENIPFFQILKNFKKIFSVLELYKNFNIPICEKTKMISIGINEIIDEGKNFVFLDKKNEDFCFYYFDSSTKKWKTVFFENFLESFSDFPDLFKTKDCYKEFMKKYFEKVNAKINKKIADHLQLVKAIEEEAINEEIFFINFLKETQALNIILENFLEEIKKTDIEYFTEKNDISIFLTIERECSIAEYELDIDYATSKKTTLCSFIDDFFLAIKQEFRENIINLIMEKFPQEDFQKVVVIDTSLVSVANILKIKKAFLQSFENIFENDNLFFFVKKEGQYFCYNEGNCYIAISATIKTNIFDFILKDHQTIKYDPQNLFDFFLEKQEKKFIDIVLKTRGSTLKDCFLSDVGSLIYSFSDKKESLDLSFCSSQSKTDEHINLNKVSQKKTFHGENLKPSLQSAYQDVIKINTTNNLFHSAPMSLIPKIASVDASVDLELQKLLSTTSQNERLKSRNKKEEEIDQDIQKCKNFIISKTMSLKAIPFFELMQKYFNVSGIFFYIFNETIMVYEKGKTGALPINDKDDLSHIQDYRKTSPVFVTLFELVKQNCNRQESGEYLGCVKYFLKEYSIDGTDTEFDLNRLKNGHDFLNLLTKINITGHNFQRSLIEKTSFVQDNFASFISDLVLTITRDTQYQHSFLKREGDNFILELSVEKKQTDITKEFNELYFTLQDNVFFFGVDVNHISYFEPGTCRNLGKKNTENENNEEKLIFFEEFFPEPKTTNAKLLATSISSIVAKNQKIQKEKLESFLKPLQQEKAIWNVNLNKLISTCLLTKKKMASDILELVSLKT